MLRFIALSTAFALLASCQMSDPGPQPTTREERLGMPQTVLDDCARSECGRLNLDSQLVENYAVVAMVHVTAFMTSYSDFNNLSDISTMSQLRELHIGSTQVSDLSGLRNHPTLEKIDMNGTTLPDDISVLTTLPNLREISVTLWDLSDTQEAVIAQLRAKGINVLATPVIIVC